MVKIGDLRHRVTVQKVIYTTDEIGGEKKVWNDAFTVWAKVKPIDAQEIYQAEQVMTEETHTVKTRYRSDVSPYDRFIFNGRILAIHSVVNALELDKELTFRCREEIEEDA